MLILHCVVKRSSAKQNGCFGSLSLVLALALALSLSMFLFLFLFLSLRVSVDRWCRNGHCARFLRRLDIPVFSCFVCAFSDLRLFYVTISMAQVKQLPVFSSIMVAELRNRINVGIDGSYDVWHSQ